MKIKFSLAIVYFCFFCLGINAQTTPVFSEGIVTYLSSQNTYVKFKSTEGFKIGDTLFANNNNQLIPALIIKNLSSSSVVCGSITDRKFNVNDRIMAKLKTATTVQKNIEIPLKTADIESIGTTLTKQLPDNLKTVVYKQIVSGYLGINSYSNLSNTSVKASTVINYTLSLNIRNLADSRLSLESNILFRQEKDKWEEVKKDIFNGLKIYNLSLKYDLNKKSSISFGRKINPNISNIGAIDGINYEHNFNRFYTGGFIGSRPDYSNYSFNFNLMQFGVYLGHNYNTSKGFMQNSLALAEQKNHSSTDRRFVYFQHSNSFIKNVNIFYSLEMDLYKVENQQKMNTLSLTSSYLSVRYRPFRKLNLSATYDARKNVIYYETDKTYLAALIETETRQGLGFQANYMISQHIFLGGRVGYRFQKSDIRPSKNANLFFSINNILKSEISATLSANLLETNYLNGNIYNIRFSRTFKNGKYNVGAAYSFANYKIANNEIPFKQHIANIDVTSEIIKKLFCSVNLEANFEDPNQFYRLYLQIRKKF
jgi:hypothetical protein